MNINITFNKNIKQWGEFMQKYLRDKKEGLLNYLQKKSIERLTIMFIPHGNDKIYSIHISFLMLVFMLFLFLALISISSYGYLKYKEIASKIEELKRLYGKNYQNTFNVQNSLIDLQKKIKNDLNKNLKEFYIKQINYKNLPLDYNETSKKTSEIFNLEIKNNQELKPNIKYLKATYISGTIKNYLKIQSNIIQLSQKSFIEKNSLTKYIPNGRPVQYSRFRDTSQFGLRLDPVSKNSFEFHAGMDMAGNYKEPIFATADGIVSKVFYDYGYGNVVMIKHPPFNFYTLYAHLALPLAKSGQKIKKGDMIGYMGSTGRVTGVHLHYEVLMNESERVNPLPFVCLSDVISYKCKAFNKNLKDSGEEEN